MERATEAIHPVRRGRARSRAWWKVGVGILLLGAVLVGIDALVGHYQRQAIEQQKQQRAKLERMAYYSLRADVQDVAHTPDGKYRVTLWMENVFPEHDLYFMLPSVRAFVQVGSQWKEVPAKEVPSTHLTEGTVINLKERITTDRLVEIRVPDYAQLIPGYIHVQINNVMFMSPEAEPKEDIVERSDSYYVYLKPFGADDRVLRKLNQFPGEVPMWIPMPPH